MNLLSTKNLSKEIVENIFESAQRIENDWRSYDWRNDCYENHKIMASFFAEPSTRTRFSFEAAMYHLGGKVLSAGRIHSGL
jgi:aspartate carbamoyltransferase catalytic subunit